MVLSEDPSEYLLFATPLYDALQLGPGEKRPARQVAPDHVSCENRILLNRYTNFPVFETGAGFVPNLGRVRTFRSVDLDGPDTNQ
jgi:hypothetical protein